MTTSYIISHWLPRPILQSISFWKQEGAGESESDGVGVGAGEGESEGVGAVES